MRFASLVRAEWTKTVGRRSTQVIMAGALAMGPIAAAVLATIVLAAGESAPTSARDSLRYPDNLSVAAWMIAMVAPVTCASFVAIGAGGEFRHDFWRMALPRVASRAELFVAKVLVIVVTLVALIALGVATWLGATWVVDAVVGGPARVLEEPLRLELEPWTSWSVIACALLSCALYSSMALLAVVVSRSEIAGLATAIIAPIALWVVRSPAIAAALPDVHVRNLFAHMIEYPPLMGRMGILFGREMPPSTSLTVVLAYILVSVTAALVVFRHRDVS